MANHESIKIPTAPLRKRLQVFMQWQGILFAIAAIIALIVGPFNLYNIGSILILIGIGLSAFGLLSTIGAWSNTRSFNYQYGMSISDRDIIQRNKDEREIMNSAFDFMFGSIGLSFTSMLIGAVITMSF